MSKIKEAFERWKKRKWYQQAGDVFFWLLLISLIIPGPRKVVATSINKIALNLKQPTLKSESKVVKLGPEDYSWDIIDDQGRPVEAENLKDEVIFLNFWGTFCPPCIAEMPEIQEIYNDYKDRVKFILVSSEHPDKVQGFLNDKGYDLPAFFGGRNLPSSLEFRSIPTTFIIARDGGIVVKKVGAMNWNSKATRKIFDELLAK